MKMSVFFDSTQNNIQQRNDYVIQKFQNIRRKFDSKSNKTYQEYEDMILKLRILKI